MRTQAQSDASRANGAKSRGPVSREGKAASSKNATKHGLLSQTLIVKGESAERFEGHLAALVAEFEPETETEMALVEKLAAARWRQLSAWGLETAGISDEIDRYIERNPETLHHPPAVRAFRAMKELSDSSGFLAALHRYDVRFDRAYFRALRELQALQK
jgi:hypothetical protein